MFSFNDICNVRDRLSGDICFLPVTFSSITQPIVWDILEMLNLRLFWPKLHALILSDAWHKMPLRQWYRGRKVSTPSASRQNPHQVVLRNLYIFFVCMSSDRRLTQAQWLIDVTPSLQVDMTQHLSLLFSLPFVSLSIVISSFSHSEEMPRSPVHDSVISKTKKKCPNQAEV